MPMQPTRRDRWLALALLLAVLSLIYLLFVHPWFTVPLQAIGQDIAALQERQQRVQAQLRQQPALTARLADVRAGLQGQPGFLTDMTAESGAATLGIRVQDAVASASQGQPSCSISNRTPMTGDRSDSPYPRVALQVRLRCGVDELASTLSTLESGSPRVFVENLNILAQRYQQSPDEAGTGLDVSFELVGYLNPDAAVDSTAAPDNSAATQGTGRMNLDAGGAPAESTPAAEVQGNVETTADEPIAEDDVQGDPDAH